MIQYIKNEEKNGRRYLENQYIRKNSGRTGYGRSAKIRWRSSTEESQEKLQDSMQKIVNDSNGGMVCIII